MALAASLFGLKLCWPSGSTKACLPHLCWLALLVLLGPTGPADYKALLALRFHESLMAPPSQAFQVAGSSSYSGFAAAAWHFWFYAKALLKASLPHLLKPSKLPGHLATRSFRPDDWYFWFYWGQVAPLRGFGIGTFGSNGAASPASHRPMAPHHRAKPPDHYSYQIVFHKLLWYKPRSPP